MHIYMSKAFKDLGHKVTTAGRSGEKAPPLDFEFTKPLVTIEEILKKVKGNFDLIFLYYPSPHFWVTNIEKSPFPTALYLMDTFIPLIKGQTGYANLFDYVFSAQIDCVKKLKKDGHKNVFWSPFAFYPKIIKNHHLKKIHNIIFLGLNNPLHNPRRAIYLKLMEKIVGLKIIKGKYLEELAKVYSQSKIVFNIPTFDDLNLRVFESLACQTLLITHKNQMGLNLLFKNNTHLITYSNIFDAVRKIKFYLNHDSEREKIAKAGYLEVQKNHTYEKRAREIFEKIKKKKTFKKILAESQCLKVAKSHYLVGAIKETDRWLQEAAQKAQSSTFARIKYTFFSKLISLGGKPLQEKLVFLYMKQGALRVLFWQFRNF